MNDEEKIVPGKGEVPLSMPAEPLASDLTPSTAPEADWLTDYSQDEVERIKAKVQETISLKDATVNPNPDAGVSDPLDYLKLLEQEEMNAEAPVSELIYLKQLDKRPATPNLVFSLPVPIPPAIMMPIVNGMDGGDDPGEQAFNATLKFCQKIVRCMRPTPTGQMVPVTLARAGWIRLFNSHPILHTYWANRFSMLMLESMGISKDSLGEGFKAR